MTLKPVSDITTMDALRDQIDQIDRDLIALLALRQAHIDRAVDIKSGNGLPARIEARVEEVLVNVRAAAEQAGFEPELAQEMWRQMVEAMIAREERHLGTGDNT